MVELIAYKYGTPRTLRGRGWCGAVANDRVLGSRVGWARAYVAEELGMAAWEPEEKDLSLVVSLLLACCIVPGLDGVFSGHLVCPRCGG